jgi:hypothetical protein
MVIRTTSFLPLVLAPRAAVYCALLAAKGAGSCCGGASKLQLQPRDAACHWYSHAKVACPSDQLRIRQVAMSHFWMYLTNLLGNSRWRSSRQPYALTQSWSASQCLTILQQYRNRALCDRGAGAIAAGLALEGLFWPHLTLPFDYLTFGFRLAHVTMSAG